MNKAAVFFDSKQLFTRLQDQQYPALVSVVALPGVNQTS